MKANGQTVVGAILRDRGTWRIAVGVLLGYLMFALINGIFGVLILLFVEPGDTNLLLRQFFMS